MKSDLFRLLVRCSHVLYEGCQVFSISFSDSPGPKPEMAGGKEGGCPRDMIGRAKVESGDGTSARSPVKRGMARIWVKWTHGLGHTHKKQAFVLHCSRHWVAQEAPAHSQIS